MTSKQKLAVGAIIGSCLAAQFGMVTASSIKANTSSVTSEKSPLNVEEIVTRSHSLSWIEAQQRKHGLNVPLQTDTQASLNQSQTNKLITTMRLMTLDL